MDDLRELVLARAEERVRNVPAVELPDGQKIDHRHEHSRPRRECDR
jgi:hypothetical protein